MRVGLPGPVIGFMGFAFLSMWPELSPVDRLFIKFIFTLILVSLVLKMESFFYDFSSSIGPCRGS
jgi:hypothetical protein